MSDQSGEGDIARDLAALREAWARVLADVWEMPSPMRQFSEATSLEEETRKMTSDAAARRAVAVARLKDAGVSLTELGDILGVSKQRVGALVTRGRQIITAATEARAISEGEAIMPASSARPEPAPVAAAIVTSDLGVLIARRNDGRPPWTFIAGKIEPGESPADAAVREVKEETGLRIRAGNLISRRVHPRTSVTMVYMAAVPTHGTGGIFVGDTEELAELRWVDPDEADRLMEGQIFEPVRQHIRRVLGDGGE
jgi:8-oxo-dGTP pyrophosphatase MutT (NUDIX family)